MITRSYALSVTLALAGCGGAQAAAPAPPPAAPPKAAETPPAPQGASPAPPEPAAPSTEPKCVAKGHVSRGGLIWPLRARQDAAATMTVEDGVLTAWISPHPQGAPWSTAVELENAAMQVRAFVAGEDVHFFLTKPAFVRAGWLPDGVTGRKVVNATDSHVSLEVGFEKHHTTVLSVPCGELGVMPGRLDSEPLLSKAGGDVVLKSTAQVTVGGEKLPASSFWAPTGAERPAGTLATERGPREKGPTQLVTIETCGGTVLGQVSKAEMVGQPRSLRNSSTGCPGAPSGNFVAVPPLSKPLVCSTPLPLFIRSATLEHEVGTLKAGARIQVDGHEEKGTTLISVRSPAVAPSQGSSFAVKTVGLAACTPSK